MSQTRLSFFTARERKERKRKMVSFFVFSAFFRG